MTALWVVLRSADRLGDGITGDELVAFARRSGLRAGGLPIKDGFELARIGGFIGGTETLRLSKLGRDALSRGSEEEPSQDVLRLFASVLVLRHPPAWVACWQGDPESLSQALPDSARHVLHDAGLLDQPAEGDIQASAWWSALGHVPLPEETAGLRKAVGDTAEELSLNYERNRLANQGFGRLASRVRWVARESPAYGFDILSFAGNSFAPLPADAELAIEVKGMAIAASTAFRMYLTHHEWDTARRIGAQHIFHLWQGIRAGKAGSGRASGPRIARLSDLELHLPAGPQCQETCRWETTQISLAGYPVST